MNYLDPTQTVNLFNMDFFSSVTAMVLAVNLITQVIKEIFLAENENKKIPKLITLFASSLVVSMHHYSLWSKNSIAFHNSLIEMLFLIFINSIFVAAVSMGNYKIMNLTKDKKFKRIKEELVVREQIQQQKEIQEDRQDLY
ncbi:hypothetical protein IZY60_05265 [Lutibacter sp. B2]|nr:hypothetical protein [Lutibacter sp. B2]